MSIVKYYDTKADREFYKVRVVRTSPVKANIRVDKTIPKIGTLVEAEKIEKNLMRELERQVFAKEAEGERWGRLVDDWIEAVQSKNLFTKPLGWSAIRDYTGLLKKYTSEWNNLSIEEIDRSKAWVLLERIDREYSVFRRKHLRTAIDGVYTWATLSGRIKGVSSPCEGYKSSRKAPEKIPEVLTLSEIRHLLKSAKELNHPWYPIWAMALMTGMRSGELYALEWDSIDFENKTIYVHRNWTSKEGYGPTKGRYWRAVPINDEMLAFLKEVKIARANEKSVFNRFNAWSKGSQAEVLRTFCVGINMTSVKFHTLRACFATQLIKDGIAPAIVMKIAGWRDLKTMQRYIRLAGIEVRGATNELKLLPETEVMGRVHELFGKA
jgi:integrase